MKILVIALAGAAGTLCRYGFGALVQHYFAGALWGTLAVNLTGSFLFGLVFALTESQMLPVHLRPYLLTGFMGAFTTFSTFMHESHNHLADGRYGVACLQVGGATIFGLAAVMVGMALGKSLRFGMAT